MTKNEFVRKLRMKLARLPKGDVEERIAFYSEMIDDRMEAGISEADAVKEIGTVESVALQIKEEIQPSEGDNELKGKKSRKGWEIALIIVGAPIWISLIAVAFSVILALFVTLWSVVITMWATFVSLLISGIALIAGGALMYGIYGSISGVAIIGAGIAVLGVALLFSYVSKAVGMGSAYITKSVFRKKP